jgi:hypothetical protein
MTIKKNKCKDQVEDQLWDQVQRQAENQVFSQVLIRVWNQTEWQVLKVLNQAYGEVQDKVSQNIKEENL